VIWHVLTGEYPPQLGGVADYTRLVARGLADAGETVHVWTAPTNGRAVDDRGVTVHELPDRFGLRSLSYLSQALDRFPAPRRLLVQYVPHAFGWKAANVPFCWWLRSRRRDSIWVMFHEVAFPFERGAPLAHNALAAVNRVMAGLVGGSAERAFVSIPEWRHDIGHLLTPQTDVEWLPVPSHIAVVDDDAGVERIRTRYAAGCPLAGHFGTHGRLIRPLLEPALRELLRTTDCRALLFGRDSDLVARELAARDAALRDRVSGTGTLDDADVSRHLAACDVLVQPYPDGITARRTSAMVALRHGRPVATTAGRLTEPLWEESGAVVLAPVDDPSALARATAALLADPAGAAEIGRRGAALYDSRFDVRHAVAALRAPTRAA
jgi:glycosyltransferase involved in cell wall biosynthesis